MSYHAEKQKVYMNIREEKEKFIRESNAYFEDGELPDLSKLSEIQIWNLVNRYDYLWEKTE